MVHKMPIVSRVLAIFHLTPNNFFFRIRVFLSFFHSSRQLLLSTNHHHHIAIIQKSTLHKLIYHIAVMWWIKKAHLNILKFKNKSKD